MLIVGGGYSKMVTLGSSKGGTSALYYGLKIGAADIIIGACQYRIGSYVSNYSDIFKGMTGNDVNPSDIEMMDNIMPEVLRNCYSKNTKISLVHSVKESTYERDIKYLINDLNTNNFSWKEYECGFANHGDVAKYFIPIAQDRLKKINKEIK